MSFFVLNSDVLSMFEFTNSAQQTETIREYEHLRYIPIVLLAPVRFSLCVFTCPRLTAVLRVIQNLPRLNCT